MYRFTYILKNIGDLDLNLITQCIQFQNFLGKLDRGPNLSTIKLSGANHSIHVNAR